MLIEFLNKLSEIWPEPENKKHHITRFDNSTLSIGIWVNVDKCVYCTFSELELIDIDALISNTKILVKKLA